MTSVVCGSGGACFTGASHIIFKGMAGEGCRLIVGFFYHQIKVTIVSRPGGAGGHIPVAPRYNVERERDASDYNKVEVNISIKWPFMKKWKKMTFIMERRWANVIVNRINQINTYNEKFNVTFTNFQNGFKVKYTNFKGKFGVKWKK